MDSLKKRYFIKLAKSGSDALINVFLLLFVPRVLGPVGYGNFNFIRDSFQSILSLADLNIGAAHINHSARKENSCFATNVYFSYVLLVGAVVLMFVLAAILMGFDQYVFPDQHPIYLFLGAILAYLMYLLNALIGLSDSKGGTFGFELRAIVVSLVLFAALLVLYITDQLDLMTFFAQRITLYVALLGFGGWYLHRNFRFMPRFVSIRDQEVRVVIHEFFSFAHPLITLSVLGIGFGLFDRWLLQIVYGSMSQGFFSLAFSLSSIASLFLAPMTPLLMQSVAKADESGDVGGVRHAFEKVKFLYLVGAFLSIFFMFHTSEIIALVGGEDYSAAWLTVLVMFLYPLHVVYGQFCGGVLIALRKTSLYRDIALVSAVMGFIVTYFFLAPTSFPVPGLGLGSVGLALKLFLIQLFSVTLQLYFVCDLIKAKFSKYLLSQIVVPIPVILVGVGEWAVRKQLLISLHGSLENFLGLASAMFVWALTIFIVVWYFPGLVGFDKGTLRTTAAQLLGVFRQKNT